MYYLNYEHTGLCKQFYHLLHFVILLVISPQRLMNRKSRTFTENGLLLHWRIRWIYSRRNDTLLQIFTSPSVWECPQITFTLSFCSKAMVVLEVCLGLLSCWNTVLRPSLRREGIMLCFSMSQYMLPFMVPSMNCSSPVLTALMQPQTMTLPPPCLTVGKTHLSLFTSPGCHHTCLTPSEPTTFILVSSDHMTWFQ